MSSEQSLLHRKPPPLINAFLNNAQVTIGIFSFSVSLPFPQALQEVTVPVVSNTDCNTAYGSITSNMLCAGKEGKDSCQVSKGTHTRKRCHCKLLLLDQSVKLNMVTTVPGTVQTELKFSCWLLPLGYWFDWFPFVIVFSVARCF